MCSNQWCISDVIPPIARTQGSRNCGVKMRVTFLTITPGGPAMIKLLISATFSPASLEILVPSGARLPSETTKTVQLN